MKTFLSAAAVLLIVSAPALADRDADIVFGDELDAQHAAMANKAAPDGKNAPVVIKSEIRALPTAQEDANPVMQGKCERRAFEVNDFGKEGPISLAKADLAKYVEKVKKREGVTNVKVSQKKPECRLYLWLGPASEYTCRIEASICW